MNRLTLCLLTILAGLGQIHLRASADAPAPGTRQTLGEFEDHPTRGYSIATYHYKPYAAYPGHKYHYLIRPVNEPGTIYLYNPYARVFYAKLDRQVDEVRFWNLSPPDRQRTIKTIDENAFQVADAPAVPESSDGLAMLLPDASAFGR